MLRKIVLGAALIVTGTAASAQIVQNGGFEDPQINNICCSTVPPDSLPGWTVSSGNVNVVNGTWGSANGNLAYQGNQYLDLVGQDQGGVGSIYQVLTTVPGQTYALSFAYSHNGLFHPEPTSASASVSIGDLTAVLTHSTGNNQNLDWRIFSGSFTASGTSSTLTFTELSGLLNGGITLDAVSVTPLPEPTTWMMMLLGFGAIGFATRRQRRSLGRVAIQR